MSLKLVFAQQRKKSALKSDWDTKYDLIFIGQMVAAYEEDYLESMVEKCSGLEGFLRRGFDFVETDSF